MKGQMAVKGGFVLESGDDGGALTDDERSYLRAFNGQWLAKGQPLMAQICKFLVAIYRADNMSAEELKVDPGLTVTQDIINSKRQITMVEHQAFIHGVTNVTEKMFSSLRLKLRWQLQPENVNVRLS